MSENLFEKEGRTRNYSRTAVLIMLKAFDDIVGKDSIESIFVEFTVGTHLYIRPKLKVELSKKLYTDLWSRMHDYIEADLPIEKVSEKVSDLYTKMIEEGRIKEAEFLHFRRTSRITITKLEDYCVYFYGSVLKRTAAVKSFDIMPYKDGFFLLLPDVDDLETIPPVDIPEKFYETNAESFRVSHELGIDTITKLNREICEGNVNDLILTSESIFDNKLALTANEIVVRGRKFVFIAGPSSSGKSSTAYRLSYALRTYGSTPHIISLDDYYRDRTELKRNNVEINVEDVDALDVEQFKSDMQALLAGNEVELPHFNFITEKREYNGTKIRLDDNDILIIEGIHSLNDRFSEGLPDEYIYKIYVSALSQFNIDEHNRIPSSDIRLLRRIVRDHRTRGYNAGMTIRMWPDVREGEEENIFPYQGSADRMIDTSMVYEIAAIKPYAERVLFCVQRNTPEYAKAKELLKFLNFVVPLSPDLIPPASIIREFIGGSCLNVR